MIELAFPVDDMVHVHTDCPHSGLEGEESVVELALGTRTGTHKYTCLTLAA